MRSCGEARSGCSNNKPLPAGGYSQANILVTTPAWRHKRWTIVAVTSLFTTPGLALTCIVCAALAVSAQVIEAQSPTQLATAKHVGLAALESGDLEAAVIAFQEAIKLGPTDFAAHRHLGSTLLQLQRFPEAVAALSAAALLRPDEGNVALDLGFALLGSGQEFAAIDPLERAMNTGLGNADTFILLGRLIARHTDDLLGALRTTEAFERAFASRRNEVALCRDLAAAYRRIGLNRQGLETIEACEAPETGPELWQERGRILDKLGRYHEAREAMHKAVTAGAAPSVDYEIGIMAISNRDVETAMTALRRAVAREPTMASGHLRLGSLLLEAGKLEAAIVSLRRAIVALPTMAEAYHLLGRALADAGKPEAALAALDEALVIDSGLLPAILGRAETLEALGRNEESQATMDELAEVQQAKRKAESSDLVDIAAATYNIHGLYYYRRGELAAAVERFQLALAIFPDNALLYENLARVYVAGNDRDLAIAALERAIEIDPRRPDPYALLADQYRALGRLNEATKVEAHYRALLEKT